MVLTYLWAPTTSDSLQQTATMPPTTEPLTQAHSNYPCPPSQQSRGSSYNDADRNQGANGVHAVSKVTHRNQADDLGLGQFFSCR